MAVSYPNFLGFVQPPSIPAPISFTNKEKNESVSIYIDGPQPVQMHGLYRIVAQFSQLIIPNNTEIGARLLGMPNNEPFWDRYIQINKIEYLNFELLPDSLDATIRKFNFILESAKNKKIDLQRNGLNLVIKRLD